MALSFKSVQKAYEVFAELKREHLPDLRIPSWPQDMSEWDSGKKDNPPLNTVLGWDKKSDDGWENIMFFTSCPSVKLKKAFRELAEKVPNTCMCEQYSRNKDIWVIGWF